MFYICCVYFFVLFSFHLYLNSFWSLNEFCSFKYYLPILLLFFFDFMFLNTSNPIDFVFYYLICLFFMVSFHSYQLPVTPIVYSYNIQWTVLLGWCKSNCDFCLVEIYHLILNTFLNKYSYIIPHFTTSFTVFFMYFRLWKWC